MVSGKTLVPGATFFHGEFCGEFGALLSSHSVVPAVPANSRENTLARGAQPELTPHPKSGFLQL